MTHPSTSIALLLALSTALPSAMAANATRSVQIDMSDAMRDSARLASKRSRAKRFASSSGIPASSSMNSCLAPPRN